MTSSVFDFKAINQVLKKEGQIVEPTPKCDVCDDGGWEMYGIGRGDPHFRECPKCHNPHNYPCP